MSRVADGTRGLTGLSRAMWLGYVRDRTAVFFTLLFPLMFLVLFGGLFKDSGPPKVDIQQVGPVAVLDDMPPDLRAGLSDAMEVTKTTDRDQALKDVRKGDADAAVEQRGDAVIVHYSHADQVTAGTVQGLLNSIVQGANLAAAGQPARFQLQAEPVDDESLSAIQYFTPGLLGWAVATSATFAAALTLVTWREKQILRRLRLAPIRTADVVFARVGTAIGVALAQLAIFLGVGLLPYFGLQLTDAWWMAIPLLMAGTLAFLAIGLLIGAWAKSVEAANGAAQLIILPMAFLSGSFFPLDNAPQWLQSISQALPLRHLNDAMLDVMVRGQSAASVLPQLALLLAIAAVLGLVSNRIFRWDRI